MHQSRISSDSSCINRWQAFTSGSNRRSSFKSRNLRRDQQRQTVRRQRTVCEATKTFYEQLEVPKSADAKTIKKAFKKMALRYHPDVNKEPDAKDKFMACKTAYQTLIDEAQRKKYDRTMEGGSGGIDWDSVGDAFRRSTGQTQRRPKQSEEEFYGFGDFFRDLEKSASNGIAQIQNIFRDLEKDFQERQAKATDQPKSLWQEVYDIGEEFVEFLEQEIGAKEKKSSKATSAQSRADAEKRARELAEEKAAKSAKEAEDKKLQAEREIEDMMADLRNKIKLKDKE